MIFILLFQASPGTRKQILFVIPLLLISAILEFASITSIYPLVSIINSSQAEVNPTSTNFFSSTIAYAEVPEYAWLLLFVVLITLSNLLRLFTLARTSKISARMTSEISSKAFNKIIRQEYLYHANNNSSDSINILTQSASNLMIYINNYIQIIISSVIIVSIIVSLFTVNAIISLMALSILSCFYLVIAHIIKSQLKINGELIKEYRNKQILTLQESLFSVKDIILSSDFSFYTSQYYSNEKQLRRYQATNTLLGLFPKYLIESLGIMVLCSIAIFLLS